MSKSPLCALAVAAALFSFPAAGHAAETAGERSDAPVDASKMPEVVAKVNGSEIKKADLENAVETVKAQLQMVGQQVPKDRNDEMYRGLLDDLIATELLAQEATNRKISVPEKEVEEFLQQFKDRFPTEEVFQTAIKEQGITEKQLRTDVKKQIQIKKLLDAEVLSKVAVDDKAAKTFYDENKDKFQEPEQVRASHVLVGIERGADDKAKAAARKEAEGVLKEAKAGKDFAALAEKHSDDPGSKSKGGDLGLFPKGEMVPAFEEVAFKLDVGQISEIVETPYGFHVIKVVEKKAGRTVPFAEVKDDVAGYLKERKATEVAKTYVDGLRKKAKVQIFI